MGELFSDPLGFLAYAVAFVAALTFHEFSHAYVATIQGDDTARRAGRLTLNPLAHLDPIGLLAMFVIKFGWAKPVPYNPYNLRDQKMGPIWIGLAGPVSNLLLATVAAAAIRILGIVAPQLESTLLGSFLAALVWVNVGLCAFNLIPIPPLDGSKLLLAALAGPQHARLRFTLETQGPMILLFVILIDGFVLQGLVFGRILGAIIEVLLKLILTLTGGA